MSREFTFKHFCIRQEKAAFKVGTDSVVLGAWAGLDDARRILDIGTGTGLLALMAAQRNPLAQILALEKDAASAEDAAGNFSASPWADRLRVLPVPLEDFSAAEPFDYLVCNPPYFLQALPSPDARKTDARHAAEGWFALLAQKVEALSAPEARFGCILPENEFDILRRELAEQNRFPLRMQRLLPAPGGKKIRVLAEWTRGAGTSEILPDLYVRDGHGAYDIAYRTLTHDFYLAF